MNHPSLRRAAGIAVLTALAPAALAGPVSAAPPQTLNGTFKLGKGSYFRIIVQNGTVKRGPFLSNANSTAANKTYTPIVAGSNGGLVTGRYQPAPSSPFDPKGNSLAARIIRPTGFFGIRFGLSTAATDKQTRRGVPAPKIVRRGGRLSGQVQAITAEWNRQVFNQGSPKPGGARPGLTQAVSGTYNARTKRYVLTWASAIVGGPFNGFTGYWRLAGTFRPR